MDETIGLTRLTIVSILGFDQIAPCHFGRALSENGFRYPPLPTRTNNFLSAVSLP
jgi:hypothetical protein